MTGRYRCCTEVLAQLEREGFEDLAFWKQAVQNHRKIDEVCEASVAALAGGCLPHRTSPCRMTRRSGGRSGWK